MSLTAIPNVTSGGMAIPLGRNMFFMRGKKHKDGGIVIGDKRKGIEVEDGEVVKLDQHNTKVFSSMPLLNGNSPASLVLNGANPQQVFRAQERFKDNVGLKDDGTNKYKDGGEDEGYGWVDAAKDVAGFLPFVGTAVDAYDFYKDPSWENAGWLAASALSDLVGARAAVKGARAAVKGARMLGRGARVGAVALGSAPRLAVDAVRATHPSRSLRVAARAVMERNVPALAFETSFNNNLVRNTLARGLAPQVANSRGLLRTGANLVGSGILTMMDPFGTAMQLLQTGRDMQKANSNKNTNNNGRKKYAAGGRGHISNRGVNLIGIFEGFMPRIYKDSGGVETIGYGETDRDFINRYRGRQISRAEATQQLRNRAQWFYDQVANKTVGWDKLNQDQRDVLTSYAYNIGVGGYQRHKKLLAAIAAGDYNLAAKNINAGMNDARNPGLRKRRLKEQFIFTNGYGDDLFNSYNKIHTNGDTKGFVKPVVVAPTATNLNEGFMTNVVPKPDPMLKDFEDLERLRYMGSRLPQFKAGGKIKHENKMLLPGNLGGNQYDVRYKDRDITYTTFAGDIRRSYTVPAGKTLREVLLADRKRMDNEAKAKRDAEQRAYDKKSWWGKTGHNIAKGAESVGNFLLPESDNTRINITKQGTIVGHQGNAAYDPMAEAVVGGKIAGPVFKYAGKFAGKALKPVGRYVAKATPVIGRAAKSVGNAVSRRVSNLVKRIPKPLSEPNNLLNRTKTAAKNVATRVSNAVENKLSSAKSAVSDFWHNTANKVSNFFTGKDRYAPTRNAGAAGNGFARVKPRPKPNPPVAARQATQRVAQQSAQSQARRAAAHVTRNGNHFIPQSGVHTAAQETRRVAANASNFTPNIPTVPSRVSGSRLNGFLSEKPVVGNENSLKGAATRLNLERYAATEAKGRAIVEARNAAAREAAREAAERAARIENAAVSRRTGFSNTVHRAGVRAEVAARRVGNFAKNVLKSPGKLYDDWVGRRVESKAAKRATNYFVDAAKQANKKGLPQPAKPTREVVESYVQKYNKKFGTNVSAENVFNRIEKPVGRAYDYIANPTVKGWAKNVWGNHKGKILTGGAALAYLGYNVLANNSNPDTTPHDAVLVKPSTNNGPAVINTPPNNQEVAPSDSTQTPNVTIQAPEDTPQNNNVPNVVVENPNTQNNTEGNTVGNSNSSETATPTNTNTGNNKAATNTTPNTATANTGSNNNTTPANKQTNTNTKPVNNTQYSSNTASTNNTTPTNNNATNNTNTTANTNTKPVITQKPNVNNQSVIPQQSVNTPSVNNVSPNTNTTNTPTNNSKPNNTTNTTVHPEVNNGKPIYEVKSNKPQLNTDNSGDKANPKFIDRLFPNADNKQNANDANSNTHMPTTQGTNKGIAVGLDGKVKLINTNSDSPYVPINTTTTPIAQRKGKYVNGNPVFNEDKSGNYTFYKDKKGNLIPSKKFKFVDSEYVLNPNYYSQENRNELGAASIANDINMQEQMKNAKYRDLDGKVIDANYKPTPVPLNPSKKSLWQKFKELDDGTKSDIVGIGSNVISGISGYLNNLHMLNSLKAPVAPVLNQAAKLKTTVNINPQLDTIDRGVQSAVRDSNENTASSNVAASRNMAASLYGVASKNQLYGNKENAETELINKDKLNQQEVARANVEAYNNYTNNVINFRNTVADKRAENFNGLLNTLNSGVQDAITKREQRTNFRNSVKASLVSNPDSALLMANAFPKLLPTDFMNELQKRQREIEENRKKALAAQVKMLEAQQGAYDRFRPVTQ